MGTNDKITNQKAPIVLFDGHCHVCNNSVKVLLRLDWRKRLKFAPLTGSTAKPIIQHVSEGTDSFMVYHEGELYTHSNAILKVCRLLGFPFNLLSVLYLLPKSWRDSFYRWFAKHRYQWFGKLEVCKMPNPKHKARFLP